MKNKFELIWNQLYSNLTTSQIEKTLRQVNLSWSDWLDFCKKIKEITANNEDIGMG